MAQLLDQGRVIGGRPTMLIGRHQPVLAEDLGRLGLPQTRSIDRLGDGVAVARALDRAVNGPGQDRRAALGGGCKDRIDPALRNARPHGVVHADQFDIGVDRGQGVSDRRAAILAAGDDGDALDGEDVAVFPDQVLSLVLGNDQEHLRDVRPMREQPDRAHEDRLVAKGLNDLAGLAAESGGRPGRRQNDANGCHHTL